MLLTRLCAKAYGVISSDHKSERLLTVPFTAGVCEGGWLSELPAGVGPAMVRKPPVSVLRRFGGGSTVDEPVIGSGAQTLTIGWPGSQTQTDLAGRTTAEVVIIAPPAA